jgi:hypothetical protein
MVTLTTTVYEKDFRFVLNKESWFYNYKNNLITKKNIIINNITNVEEFLTLKKEFENYFDFYYSSDYVDRINQTFNLNININEPSYYYSVQHYTNVLINPNNFSFYVGADCTIVSDNITKFIDESIKILNSKDYILSTTLSWCEHWKKTSVPNEIPQEVTCVGEWEQINTPSYTEDKALNDFWCCGGFSDQVYFIDTNKIKKADFTITEHLRQFPNYGINSFEFRLTNHYIINNKYRAIYKGDSHYIHNSF